MMSIHVFAQFKLHYDALTRLSPDDQAALDRAVLGSTWIRDVNGNLLSPVQPVVLPAVTELHSTQDVNFDWPDSATRGLAQSVAQPHLLVCEAVGISDRSDMQIHQHGVVADEAGQPMTLFTSVPRGVVTEIQKQLQAAIGRNTSIILAYRAVPTGETVRAAEVQTLVRRRDRRVQKVKTADVCDVRLERFGPQARVRVSRRATLRESGPAAAPQAVLGGSAMSRLILHALSGHRSRPFGAVNEQGPDEPTSAAQALLRGLTEARPPVAPAPDVAPRPKRTPKPSPLPDPQPAPALHPNPEPLHSPEAAPTLVEPEPAVDPWQSLPGRMAVDPDVLTMARLTLERHRPLLLTGAPGVGKTLLATLLAEACCGEGNYTLVTADARWTSTEVLGGLRVVPGDTLKYAFTEGVVTRAVQRHARSMDTTGRPHALIIDEFNRAHQDEAFGRLLTVLDPRYRTQLPLVDETDGADRPVYLPGDFLLIGTMNDADTARLHDLSAALQRRFTTVGVTIPAAEGEHLKQLYPDVPLTTFNTLYAMLGVRAARDSRGEAAPALRQFVPLGTHFVTEVIEYVQRGLTLDAALQALVRGHLGTLTRADLGLLADRAGALGLPLLQDQLAQAGTAAEF